MKTIGVGIIGSGFAAHLHLDAYRCLHGLDVQLRAVASVDPALDAFAAQYQIPNAYTDYRRMLDDPTIDVIDIITPPYLHVSMVRDVLAAGKHVICEKPLTGYFGDPQADGLVGRDTPKRAMYEHVIAQMDDLRAIVERSGRLFLYAENFVYAPGVQKTVNFLAAKQSKILYMRGEEAHCGSHAHHAAYWKYNGGGSFIRQGCHPLSAVLYLKYKEAAIRGERVAVKSVLGDMGVTQACLREEEKEHILSRPVDVEDQASVLLTFTDGTKANIVAGDMVLGGVRNLVEVFTNHGAYLSNIAPNDHMLSYHVNERNLEDIYVTEKVETKAGWQRVFLDEAYARGYVGELQDFLECIACGRQPQSDFALAYDTTKVVYAAYWSAEEGRRVDLS